MSIDFNGERPDFDYAQNKATDLLLMQNIDSLFIDVRNFVFDRAIIIDSVQHYASVVCQPTSNFTCSEFSGCCLLSYPRCCVILYDDSEENEERKHWGIVHEIGHIYLGHDEDGPIQEIEAHFFAAQIVTPEIALMEIVATQGRVTAPDLYGVFNVSLESSRKRIHTITHRKCWSSGERDKKLLEKFKPLIHAEFGAMKHSQRLQVNT